MWVVFCVTDASRHSIVVFRQPDEFPQLAFKIGRYYRSHGATPNAKKRARRFV
jgi:hypothetical protein